MDILKKCPNCGRHFSVERRGKELVGTEHHTEHVELDRATRIDGMVADGSIQHPPVTPVSEEIPVETETFETTFECVHCHHTWTEKSTKVIEGTTDPKGFQS
jgi:transposase-like protein